MKLSESPYKTYTILDGLFDYNDSYKRAILICDYIEQNPKGDYCEEFQLKINKIKDENVCPVHYSIDNHILTLSYEGEFDRNLFETLISIELAYIERYIETNIKNYWCLQESIPYGLRVCKERNYKIELPTYKEIFDSLSPDDFTESEYFFTDNIGYKKYIKNKFALDDYENIIFKYIIMTYFIKCKYQKR